MGALGVLAAPLGGLLFLSLPSTSFSVFVKSSGQEISLKAFSNLSRILFLYTVDNQIVRGGRGHKKISYTLFCGHQLLLGAKHVYWGGGNMKIRGLLFFGLQVRTRRRENAEAGGGGGGGV